MVKKKKSRGSWKKERASVSLPGKSRPRSNKYRPKADSTKRPPAGTRKNFWRGGFEKKDGTKVRGHYVRNPHYKGK